MEKEEVANSSIPNEDSSLYQRREEELKCMTSIYHTNMKSLQMTSSVPSSGSCRISSPLVCKDSAVNKMSSVEENISSKNGGKRHNSKFLGVRQRPSGRWVAEIKHASQKLRLWLGTFDSAEDAARAYDDAARFLRGKNTRTNFAISENSKSTQGNSSKAAHFILLRHALAKAPQKTPKILNTRSDKYHTSADTSSIAHLDQANVKYHRNGNNHSTSIDGDCTTTTTRDEQWVLSSSSGGSHTTGLNYGDFMINSTTNAGMQLTPNYSQCVPKATRIRSLLTPNGNVSYSAIESFCTSGWNLQQSFISDKQNIIISNQSQGKTRASAIRVAPSFNASLYSEAERCRALVIERGNFIDSIWSLHDSGFACMGLFSFQSEDFNDLKRAFH
eukprot:Gb_29359 [translate_table: standard]